MWKLWVGVPISILCWLLLGVAPLAKPWAGLASSVLTVKFHWLTTMGRALAFLLLRASSWAAWSAIEPQVVSAVARGCSTANHHGVPWAGLASSWHPCQTLETLCQRKQDSTAVPGRSKSTALRTSFWLLAGFGGCVLCWFCVFALFFAPALFHP